MEHENLHPSRIFKRLLIATTAIVLLGISSCSYDPNIYSQSGYQSYNGYDSYDDAGAVIYSDVSYHRSYYPRRSYYEPRHYGTRDLKRKRHYSHRHDSYRDQRKWKRNQRHDRRHAHHDKKGRRHSDIERPQHRGNTSEGRRTERRRQVTRVDKQAEKQRNRINNRRRSLGYTSRDRKP